ncbi:hypothetical protein S7711_11232 [Stachybotrys chartarum IBT 7711]|uniref:Uncharacterized protein n=1 Tax=Stachybotrys chartarum (strain CBS 109288 / IBT 7711) TaxID=1280523 RepID=A0A084AQM2_STACB|nr:hypothetical protein S7711_11232 [Stachybotrys chartarum IBT 7711]
MDNLYGIGAASYASPEERPQPRRDSTISLEDYAEAVKQHYNTTRTSLAEQRPVPVQDVLKSPLMLMRPHELRVPTKQRPVSPTVSCALLSTRPRAPSPSPISHPLAVWAFAEDSHEDRTTRLSLARRTDDHTAAPRSRSAHAHIESSREDNFRIPSVATNMSTSSMPKGNITMNEVMALEPEPHYADQLGNPIPFGRAQLDSCFSLSVQPRNNTESSSDSSISDFTLPEGLPAARHIELDRVLKDAGLEGLGDCGESRKRYSRPHESSPGSTRVFRRTKRRLRSKIDD